MPARVPAVCRIREIRLTLGMSQQDLADRARLHRNSISKLERGVWKQVTQAHAAALASALGVPPGDLGLEIRPEITGAPRSVRFRRLTADQRKLLDEMMSLPPEQFEVMRRALEYVRADIKRKAKRRK